MWLALVGIAGIILGALMTSLFNHWAWLQARRLDEYAALVTAFLASASASAAAAQGRTIYDPDAPAERASCPSSCRMPGAVVTTTSQRSTA